MKELAQIINVIVTSGNIYLIVIVCFIFTLYILWKSGILESFKNRISNKQVHELIKIVGDDVKSVNENIKEPIKKINSDLNDVNSKMLAINVEVVDIKDNNIEHNIEIYRKYEELNKNINDMAVKLAVIKALVENINNRSNNYNQSWGTNPNNGNKDLF